MIVPAHPGIAGRAAAEGAPRRSDRQSPAEREFGDILRGRAGDLTGLSDNLVDGPQSAPAPGGSVRSFADVDLFGHAARFSSFAARIDEQPLEAALTAEQRQPAAAGDEADAAAPRVLAAGVAEDNAFAPTSDLPEVGKLGLAPGPGQRSQAASHPVAAMSGSGVLPAQSPLALKSIKLAPARPTKSADARAAQLRAALVGKFGPFSAAVTVRAGAASVVMRVAGAVRGSEVASALQHALRPLGIIMKSLRLNGHDWLDGENP